MDPKKSGWLAEYLEFREGVPRKKVTFGRHPDESLYRMIQPTGIMYGQPVNAVAHPDMEEWSARSKMKVLLLESLLNSSYLFQQHEMAIHKKNESIVQKIGDFYTDVYPDFSLSKKTFFGKKREPLEIAERAIDKRIEMNYLQEQNFWSRFFNNSLLFVDIYLFGQWIHTEGDKMVVDFLREEKNSLYNTVCQVMAAAAHSNKNIEEEERRLFNLFVNSTGLSNDEKKITMGLFEKGLSLTQINFGDNVSWIVKKYYLELASLTIWADKKVEDSEVHFLTNLSEMLGFNEDDFENSMIAVEAFVIRHWQELDYLQTKRNFEIVSERFAERLGRMMQKNSDLISKSINSNPGLRDLLLKASVQTLNEAELYEVETSFLEAIRSIPAFSIIELPEKFLDYKIIKRIIPASVMKNISAAQ